MDSWTAANCASILRQGGQPKYLTSTTIVGTVTPHEHDDRGHCDHIPKDDRPARRIVDRDITYLHLSLSTVRCLRRFEVPLIP